MIPHHFKPLAEIANNRLDELWDEAESCVLFAREIDQPTPEDYARNPEPSVFEGSVSSARLKQLKKGALPSDSEIRIYRQAWWDEQLMNDEPDADCIPGYALATVRVNDDVEGVALILRTGYSFSGLETWLEGIFFSSKDATDYMTATGFWSER